MESELDQQYVNQLVAKTFDLYMGVDQDGDLCGYYNNLNGKRFNDNSGQQNCQV